MPHGRLPSSHPEHCSRSSRVGFGLPVEAFCLFRRLAPEAELRRAEKDLRRSCEMTKLRRSALWLAVVIAAGVLLTPLRGAAGPSRWYVPDEQPSLGDPDGGGSGVA